MNFSTLVRSALLLFFIASASYSAVGSTPNVQFFDYSNGLTNEKITRFCKDKSGLMWIGSEGALMQFNGYEFDEVVYFKNHQIRTILYDTIPHVLWIGTNQGLFLLDIATRTVTNTTERWLEKEVVEIGVYNQKKVVVFKSGRILIFSPDGKVDMLFGFQKQKEPGSYVTTGGFDNRGNLLLLIKGGGVHRVLNIHLATNKRTNVSQLSADKMWSIQSGDGYFLIMWDNNAFGLYSVDKGFSSFTIPHSQEDNPLRVVQEMQGSFLVSYRESYKRFVLTPEGKLKLVEEEDLRKVMKSKTIRRFYLDDEGVLWMGTTKGIVKVYHTRKYPFKRILSEPNNTVSVRQIISGGKNKLYIATYDGIFEYNTLTEKSLLLSNTTTDKDFPLYARTLFYDGHKYVYAGTESNQNFFFRFNTETNKFETHFFRETTKDANMNSVFSMIQDQHGTIWMATNKGLASFNPKTGDLTLHKDDKFSVGNKRLIYITTTQLPNQFIVCGAGGAFLVDINHGVQVSYDVSDQLGIAEVEYQFATEDQHQQIWLGSLKHGVIVVSKNGRNARLINKANGLSHNEVYSVIWQGNDIAWMSTANGLSRYHIPTESFQNYFDGNGIADDEFNQHSFFKQSDSLIYMGGINGITCFNPFDFKTEHNHLEIFLATITRWSNVTKNKEVSFTSHEITMTPADYLIMLNFGLNDFSTTEANTFYYKINDINSHWIELGTENTLTLNGLAPGNYEILIKGYNKRGMGSLNTLSFPLLIKDRFYKRWWFWVVLCLVVIGGVYVYFRWRLSRITQRQMLRTQISSNLHDEVGSLLTQIIISTEGAMYGTFSLDEKNKRLSKIANLSRNAINTMSDVLWSIDSRNDFVGNLTDRMREHAEMVFSDKEIELSFEFTNARVSKTIDSNVRQHVYLIFKEALHNILKHSKSNKVKVSYWQNGGRFELKVSNNNHHLAPEGSKIEGQGIRNMNMRAKKINAVCNIEVISDWYTVTVGNL